MKVLLRYSTLAILLLTFGWLAHTPGWEPAILLDTFLAAWSDAGETGCGIAAARPERLNYAPAKAGGFVGR